MDRTTPSIEIEPRRFGQCDRQEERAKSSFGSWAICLDGTYGASAVGMAKDSSPKKKQLIKLADRRNGSVSGTFFFLYFLSFFFVPRFHEVQPTHQFIEEMAIKDASLWKWAASIYMDKSHPSRSGWITFMRGKAHGAFNCIKCESVKGAISQSHFYPRLFFFGLPPYLSFTFFFFMTRRMNEGLLDSNKETLFFPIKKVSRALEWTSSVRTCPAKHLSVH